MSHDEAKSYVLLHWVARIIFLVSIAGIFIVTLYYYHPLNTRLGLSPQVGQTVWYVGWLLAITIYAWLWPTPGGAMAVLYGIISIIGLFSDLNSLYAMRTVLVPTHFLLYGIFIIGGFLHLFVGMRKRPASTTRPYSKFGLRRLLWSARIMTIVSVIAFIIFFYPHGWLWILPVGVSAYVLIGVAWLQPKLGGALLISYAIFTFFAILGGRLHINTQVVLLVMWAVFLAGSIMQAYLGKRYLSKPEDNW